MKHAPVFISHPPSLDPAAAALAAALAAGGLSVVGAVNRAPGDFIDTGHLAQRRARVTVALVEPQATADWYQSEDIARAIALARAGGHRLLPIICGDGPPTATPYGLQRLVPLLWRPGDPPTAAAQAIRRLLGEAAPPTPAKAARTVFLLYARRDTDWAEWVADALVDGGFAPRLADWDLCAGADRWLYVDGQLGADKVLLLVSRHTPGDAAVAATWSAAFGDDPAGARAQLVPVLLDGTAPPRLLRARVAIDLRGVDEASAAQMLARGLGPRRRSGRAPFPGGSR